MKNLMKLVLTVVIFIMSHSAQGQAGQSFSDEIIIAYNDSMQIKIHVPNYRNKRSYMSVNDAFLKFQALFTHFVDKLPDYQYYSMKYEYGKQITTSRLPQEEVYYIVEDSNLKVRNFRSVLTITGSNFMIEVEFIDVAQLTDPDIQKVINTAIGELPGGTIMPATINYLYREGTLTKPADHFRKHGSSLTNIGMTVGASFGFTNGLLSYGINSGIGYMHKVKNVDRSYYYFGVSAIGSYNQEKGMEEGFGHINLGARFKSDDFFYNIGWLGYEIGFPLQKNQKYFGDPIGLKFGFSYQLGTNLWWKFEMFDVKGEGNGYYFFGVGVGF